ncbi:hypothetical protein chiPu_0032520, partial [Chiloscyllium punctatum]|nr:hypothetical protein [Chiloscyllium punctatum]
MSHPELGDTAAPTAAEPEPEAQAQAEAEPDAKLLHTKRLYR